ncbi:MAG: hypothetical protein HC933_00270 [Pleurocapsa sp. SU_196_0]|nr:hypothetical protein [Pleurocapsa sp. SU_196_0]
MGNSFLVVQARDREDDEALVYSNLEDHNGPDVPPTQARDILETLGVQIPAGFLDALERDRFARPGNLEAQYVTYAGDGRPQLEVWLRRDRRGESPFLEETHDCVYTSLEPLGTSLEEGATAVFERLSSPRSALIVYAWSERRVQTGDVVRVQHPDGKLESLERTEAGWRVCGFNA